jgi:pentose-5-phosphate-3-epimerase
LVTTVNPVFGDQAFLTEALPEVRTPRGLDPWIDVDAGVNAIVAVAAIIDAPDHVLAIDRLRSHAAPR